MVTYMSSLRYNLFVCNIFITNIYFNNLKFISSSIIREHVFFLKFRGIYRVRAELLRIIIWITYAGVGAED